MTTRLLILTLCSTVVTLAGGCNGLQPIVTPAPTPAPQPVVPAEPQKVIVEVKVADGKLTVNDATISVKGSASAERCVCGCDREGCRCSGQSLTRPAADSSGNPGPQIRSALKDSKPVVEMLTDFEDGQCGACDLAWSDWKANGRDWPFVLVKRRGTGGRTSPTFLMPGREPWSPQSYSTGGLLQVWKSR